MTCGDVYMKITRSIVVFSRTQVESTYCDILQDDHLFNHIVKNNLLKPVIDVFVDNGSRYNLLNSAVLEFFEHVRRVSIVLTQLNIVLYKR